MRIAVFGSTGGTGREICKRALELGHDVTAFARRPASLMLSSPHLRVVKGDVLDIASVAPALAQVDAVLSALGTKQIMRPTTVMSKGTAHIIASMREQGVRRIICETSSGACDSESNPFIFRLMGWFVLRHVFADHRRVEEIVRKSGLDWTVIRPPMLTNGPRTGSYRLSGERLPPNRGWPRISRADVADFMVKEAAHPTNIGRAVFIAY